MQAKNEETLLHATAVAINGRAILIRGGSGTGKSDLALRLIDEGAVLVADDYICVSPRNGSVYVSAPDEISGKMEVRGLGVLAVDCEAAVLLALVADLVTPEKIERLPEPSWCRIRDITVPRIDLTPFEASATAKLRAALRFHGDLGTP